MTIRTPSLHPSDLLGHVRHGNGPIPVLVLHDWLGDHTGYDALLPYLDAQRFCHVFADLRGYGLSREQAPTCRVQDIAADCLALADHLGWSRFHVMGHSMTGMVTQRLAADAPARIISAIALCPVSAAGNRLPPDARAFFASTTTDDAALARLLRFVSGGMSADWVAAKVQQNRASVAPAAREGYLQMLVNTDFVAEVQGIATPFLVIVGDRDPGLDADAMARTFLAWHPQATLAVMQGCGHYPMAQQPAHLAALMATFLSR
ncbi:alpha/beta hydrolase [Stenotrophomonas sp. 24(2023)]|uniref:alpha/beta fold hydrolase n=1 Tax=Stenotrophomonas sp. 24(2023) TaxID=3068324 RepID=UPI0027E1F155|nr:alpha/beta hydrolase [Stenotrophomonas sp. 24(2023)]WMJ69245.1 alpha/beta hydrolase [Stenotrophomonas sp. 24(2023)]